MTVVPNMPPQRMPKAKKKPRDYLKEWGFLEMDWETPIEKLGLSGAQRVFIYDFIKTFPHPTSRGIVFQGHPKKAVQASTRIVAELYEQQKIKNRVKLIDIPSILLNFTKNSFESKDAQDSELLGDLNNSDLIIFQEIALAQWTEAQQARLYIMLQQRYSRNLPFICTVNCDEETFEKNVGPSNFFRINDLCTFIEMP